MWAIAGHRPVSHVTLPSTQPFFDETKVAETGANPAGTGCAGFGVAVGAGVAEADGSTDGSVDGLADGSTDGSTDGLGTGRLRAMGNRRR